MQSGVEGQSDSRSVRVLVAGAIGNALEWYDFAIYGYFATILGKQFFPQDDPVASLLSVFGIFAAGFLMRPLGGLLFGPIGDRFGRRLALSLSVACMAIPTFIVGLLPTAASIGVAAPIALVVLRLLQGLSVGGEYTSSMTLLVEQAPQGRRAFWGCWSVTGSVVGFVLGSSVSAMAAALLSPDELSSWGWRIPFLLGAVVGVAGVYLRGLGTTELKPESSGEAGAGFELLGRVLREHGNLVLRISGLQAMAAVGFFLMFTYVTTALTTEMNIPEAEALAINTGTLLFLMVAIPLAAILSDRIGRRPVLLGATLGTLLLAYPLFLMMHGGSIVLTILGELVFAVLIALFYGAGAATMAEMTPRAIRCTVLALGYNLVYAILGGTTPMIAAYLVQRTGDDLSPAYFLMSAAAVSLVVVGGLRETSRSPLP